MTLGFQLRAFWPYWEPHQTKHSVSEYDARCPNQAVEAAWWKNAAKLTDPNMLLARRVAKVVTIVAVAGVDRLHAPSSRDVSE
jgi:hypothetical protein